MSSHSHACCNLWPFRSFCKWGDKYANEAQIQKEDKGEGRYIPIKSGSDEALPSSSESEIVLFSTGASSGSSKMSADPSEDRSRSGPRVVEPGMEEGVTTSEALPFAAWEISAKGRSSFGLNNSRGNGTL